MKKSIAVFLCLVLICGSALCAPLASDDQTALLMNFDSRQKGAAGPALISGIYNKAGLFLSRKNVIAVAEKTANSPLDAEARPLSSCGSTRRRSSPERCCCRKATAPITRSGSKKAG